MLMGRPNWWLCVAPAVLCLFDAGVTLYFQPAEYWTGDHSRVHEFSPIDHWMLKQHPALFLAWVMVWIAAFCVAISKLPTRIALGPALFLIFNNSTGAGSWLGSKLPHGAWAQSALYLATAVLSVFTWNRARVIGQQK